MATACKDILWRGWTKVRDAAGGIRAAHLCGFGQALPGQRPNGPTHPAAGFRTGASWPDHEKFLTTTGIYEKKSDDLYESAA